MSLRLWLPLNGDLKNNGIDDVTITNNGAIIDNNGKIGKCYYFNGSGYLSAPFDYSNFSNQFSAALWVKFPSTTSSYTEILNLANSAGWAIIYFGMVIPANSTSICCSVADGAHYLGTKVATGNIGTNKWTHICFTYDNGNIVLYVDGTIKQTYTTTIVPTFSSANKIGIGAASNGAEKSVSYINDVRIYDHALSEKEVKKISQGLILHYALNRSGFGQENLMKNSSRKLDNAGYYVGTYAFANPSELVAGEKYTFSFSGELQDETQTGWYFNIFPSPYTHIGSISTTEDGRYSFTFTMPENGGNRTSIGCYSTPLGNYKGCAIWDVKLEKGEKATPWCPNSADTEYTTLGLNDNTEYDLSGYNRNAVRTNGITYDSDSPKYNVSSVFDGHPYTYVKCDSIDWMIPMTELTISCWCYMDDWTWFGKGYGRLWSCTESGGFNVEWLNSKMEFAICTSPSGYLPSEAKCGVTLSDLTSGWHLFTYIYTTVGTRLYIDGNLYKSYEISSNYVSYNTSARLFLGCEAYGSSECSPYFKGKMSDFRLYVTVLSQADIAELYSIHRS